MTNIINSHLSNNNNAIPAKHINSDNKPVRNVGVISVPDQLPKYTIDKALQEKDTFRKNVLADSYQRRNNQKKKKNIFKTLVFIGLSAITVAMCKNI